VRGLDAVEVDLAAGHARFTADDVAEGGLAGAVGSDDDAQLVAVNGELVDVQRPEASKLT